MGLKSLFYRITGQQEKYQQQVIADKQLIFEEAQLRISNLKNGIPANSHHGRFKQSLTAIVDGYSGFYTSHSTFLAGVGLAAAALAGATAPPLGFAALGISAVGFCFDRLSGRHDARKGLRDIERFLKLIHATEQEIVNKSSKQGMHITQSQEINNDPVISRIRATRRTLLNEYIKRFSVYEQVPADELQEFIVSNSKTQNAETSEEGNITARIMSKIADKTPAAASQSLKLAHLQYASQIAGNVSAATYIAIGGARRIYQIAGRSSWDIRIKNAVLSKEILSCVNEARSKYRVSLPMYQKDLDKITSQASRPQKYINEWENTSKVLTLTTSHKSELEKLIKEVASGNASPLKLQQALKNMAEDAKFFKTPLVLGIDRIKFWKTNPIKELAHSIAKLGKILIKPKDLQYSLNKLNTLLNDIDGKIQEAITRNDNLVGHEHAETYRSRKTSQCATMLKTEEQQTSVKQKGPAKLISKAKIAASGTLSAGAAIMAMPDVLADAMDFVMDLTDDINPSMALTTAAAVATGIAIKTLRKTDKKEADNTRPSLAETPIETSEPGRFTQAELARRGAKSSSNKEIRR